MTEPEPPTNFAALTGPEKLELAAPTLADLARELQHARENIHLLTAQLEDARRAGAQARRELEAASQARDRFLSSVSHQLRTPLSSIVLWISLIEDQKIIDAPQLAEALAAIRRSAEEQRELIEDLADVSRIASGRFRLELTRPDLVQIVRAGVDAARPLADEKHVAIDARIDVPAETIRGDAHRLERVIRILLNHAVKSSTDGSRVAVALDRADGSVRISIRHPGAGFPPELLPRVFDQTPRDAETRGGNVDFGFMIARHIVELHGGSIRVDSAGIEMGSTFTILLPRT